MAIVFGFGVFVFFSVDILRDMYGPSALLAIYGVVAVLTTIAVYGVVERLYTLVDKDGDDTKSDDNEEDDEIVDQEVETLKNNS